jgi:hypothetical protein
MRQETDQAEHEALELGALDLDKWQVAFEDACDLGNPLAMKVPERGL